MNTITYITHFSVGIQGTARCLTRILPGNIMGKRFANDFDTQPVQRINALLLVILSDIELCIVGLVFVVVAKLSIFAKIE